MSKKKKKVKKTTVNEVRVEESVQECESEDVSKDTSEMPFAARVILDILSGACIVGAGVILYKGISTMLNSSYDFFSGTGSTGLSFGAILAALPLIILGLYLMAKGRK